MRDKIKTTNNPQKVIDNLINTNINPSNAETTSTQQLLTLVEELRKHKNILHILCPILEVFFLYHKKEHVLNTLKLLNLFTMIHSEKESTSIQQ